jgi:hypothetical protein
MIVAIAIVAVLAALAAASIAILRGRQDRLPEDMTPEDSLAVSGDFARASSEPASRKTFGKKKNIHTEEIYVEMNWPMVKKGLREKNPIVTPTIWAVCAGFILIGAIVLLAWTRL